METECIHVIITPSLWLEQPQGQREINVDIEIDTHCWRLAKICLADDWFDEIWECLGEEIKNKLESLIDREDRC